MKILVAAFAIFGGVLIARLVGLQIADADQYRRTASAPERVPYRPIPATRGRILARSGGGKGTVELVGNEPCFELAVYYPVMDPDEYWILGQHRAIHRRLREESRDPKLTVGREELALHLQKQLEEFWQTLSRDTDVPVEELLDRRDRIVQSIRRRIDRIRARQEDEVDYLIGEQRMHYPMVTDLDEKTALALRAKTAGTDWAVVRPSVRRVFRRKDTLCHLLGNARPIPGSREEVWRKEDKDYLPGELQGKWGAELIYDKALRGSRGWLKLGKTPIIETPPIDGNDVTLTIDVDLQEYIQKRLTDRLKDPVNRLPYALGAAAVVIDVKSDELLAAVSVPTFDSAEYNARYKELLGDRLHAPLVNRAFTRYPPGSIVKPLVGAWALERGKTTSGTTFDCQGALSPTLRTFRCWLASGHGPVALEAAIMHSCDIYFYHVGERLTAEGMVDLYHRVRFDRSIPIDFPNLPGHIPNPAWFIRTKGRGMSAGDARNLAIGQGDLEISPLQAAVMTGALITGRFQPPRVVVGEPLPESWSLGISPNPLRIVRQGMVDAAANTQEATAHYAFSEIVPLAAKTGSAQAEPKPMAWEMLYHDPVSGERVRQVVTDREEFYRHAPVPRKAIDWRTVRRLPELRPEDARDNTTGREKHLAHAWIIGFAPVQRPRIAVAVFIEYGLAGGSAAGPVLKDIVEKCHELGYLKKK